MFHRIVTHNGTFHADDVLACAALIMSFNRDDSWSITHTRSEEMIKETLASLDPAYIIDVGGIYREGTPYIQNWQLDHHQKGGAGTRTSINVPYASAGLVWKHFGGHIVFEFGITKAGLTTMTQGEVDLITNDIDMEVFVGVDAVDNGMENFYSPLSDIVSSMNRPPLMPSVGGISPNDRFNLAIQLVTNYLQRKLEWAFDRLLTEKEFGRVVKWSYGIPVLPWYMKVRETILPLDPHTPMFFVYPDEENGWIAGTVPIVNQPKIPSRPFPVAWAGLRGQELAAVTGVEDATFCHNGLWIAGAKSRFGALTLAHLGNGADIVKAQQMAKQFEDKQKA